MDKVEEIKQKINITDIARQSGIALKPISKSNQSYRALCPFHNDHKTPNLTIYGKTNTFKCFGCNVSGDAINFYAKLHNLENADAIRELANYHGIKNQAVMTYKGIGKVKPTPNPLIEVSKWTAFTDIYQALKDFSGDLSPDSLAYLTGNKRGLSQETIKRFGIFDIKDYKTTKEFLLNNFVETELKQAMLINDANRFVFIKHKIVIPIYSEGKIITLRARFFDNGLDNPDMLNSDFHYPKYCSLGGIHGHFFNEDILQTARQGESIVLCEGEFDTMILTQRGYKAIGLMGVSNYDDTLISKLQGFDLIISFDNDEAGRKQAEEVADIFRDITGREAKINILPKGIKDITELYLRRQNGDL